MNHKAIKVNVNRLTRGKTVIPNKLVEEMGWREFLSAKGFNPVDAPYSPIRKEWESFPIVKAIRGWERESGMRYKNGAYGES